MEQQYDNTNKGAMWLKTSKSGNKFLSGKLNYKGEEIELVAFKNEKARPDNNLPLYRVQVSEPRENTQDVNAELQRDRNDELSDF